jgi:hypothetical protein
MSQTLNSVPTFDGMNYAFVAPHVEEEDSYYSEHSENEEELKEAYKTVYKEFEKLREGRKQYLNDLNSLQTEKSSLLLKV